MPTKAELFAEAKQRGLPVKTSMTKDAIAQLLSSGSIKSKSTTSNTPNYTKDLVEVKDSKGLMVSGQPFKKVWEQKLEGSYVAIVKNGNSVVVVEGRKQGSGLGLGGAKWTYKKSKVIS